MLSPKKKWQLCDVMKCLLCWWLFVIHVYQDIVQFNLIAVLYQLYPDKTGKA